MDIELNVEVSEALGNKIVKEMGLKTEHGVVSSVTEYLDSDGVPAVEFGGFGYSTWVREDIYKKYKQEN